MENVLNCFQQVCELGLVTTHHSRMNRPSGLGSVARLGGWTKFAKTVEELLDAFKLVTRTWTWFLCCCLLTFCILIFAFLLQEDEGIPSVVCRIITIYKK